MSIKKVINLDYKDSYDLNRKAYECFSKRMASFLPLEEQEKFINDMLTEEPTTGKPSPEELAAIFNDIKNFPDEEYVGRHFNRGARTIRRWVSEYRKMGYDHLFINRRRERARLSKDPEDEIYLGSGGRVSNAIQRVPAFPGDFYRDKTKIPRQRWESWWKIWQRKTPVRERPRSMLTARTYYRKIFLLGYEMSGGSRLFNELWYDAFNGVYIIYDHQGIPYRRSFHIMDDAVTAFINIIAEEDPGVDVDSLDGRDALHLNKAAFDNRAAAEREGTRLGESFVSLEECKEAGGVREKFLTETTAARAMFADIINSDMVEQYTQSRMSKYIASRNFYQVFGKEVAFPPRHVGRFRNVSMKIISFIRNEPFQEGIFVDGYTVANKIDIEIWYITEWDVGRKQRTKRTSFAVFDLTSGKIIGSGIPDKRTAVATAFRKIAVLTPRAG